MVANDVGDLQFQTRVEPIAPARSTQPLRRMRCEHTTAHSMLLSI